ncbi:uncharacterized protein TRIADDRAFT_53542 [Trichoplax adhaerens]|uniref:DUF5745 domain-containing protein n=1 Tax=Trichoplax adhaerens TaxID=10228 RepID=B3RPH1_TRIAD|nr:hypothetical protein TRIADDRAFT_53542 [Trichoplax adhaerens]EDV28187.1 hypothetical protein TRIADDRAFT_53542 [Trichoplax adhaerens]|eukprot:XP_002110021.1 hypothetical protein TRIADDRAFT_53542 [Trichoplax adhaerens]
MDLIPNLDYIDVTNQLLKRCGSKIRIQHLAECTVEVFADIYRGLFHRLPPDYIQYPSGLQDRIHNCQLLIDSLAKDILKTDLSHISGEEIARGSLTRVQFLLEIYFGLKECYLDWKKPHSIEGIDFDSDTESVDSNGLDDIGKSIIKTVIEQELENDSSDFEKENINQKLISRDFMNDNVRSNSSDTSKAASSKFHTKIFRKHYLRESVTSDQDSSDSDSTYDLIAQVAVANDAISSTDSLNDDDLRQEVDNVTTPKLDIAHHKVNRKKINKISGDYDDKARKLDDFQVLDEYYSLLSSQNDSDLILQSSLSSHSLTPESSESNSLDEKIETAINIQRENWSKSIENKYDNANPVGAKLGGLMDGDKSCEKGSISNRISNNKSFGDDERLTRLDNTDGNKVEKASYTSVISHHTGDKTDRQHEYRQTVIDSQLAKNKNDYSDMLLTETKPPPETKELKDYQSKNANSGDEVQRNSIFESSSELSSKNHDSSHLNTTDNNRYKKLATADTKLYKTENYRNALIEKNDSKKRYQNLEIDIKDLKNNITNISEKASCSDDYSETNPNEVGNNAELNQDKYAQLKETLRNLREQRSTFPSQPISTEEPLVDSYSRNPSVRFADYVRDRSLEEFDGSLSNEEKYFSNTNNTKIVDRKYRYDEVKSGPTRKQSKRRDINDETAKDLIQKIRNRNVLQTKEVQRQLEREKQIERLCLELLKSSYQHELEDLSLERKEEITATKKVAFKNKNDKNKKKQKHHPKSTSLQCNIKNFLL